MKPAHEVMGEAGMPLSKDSYLPSVGGLSLQVELSEALGADTVIYGRLADGHPLQVRIAGMPLHRPGDRLAVAPRADDLHLFDPRSGRRLPAETAGIGPGPDLG